MHFNENGHAIIDSSAQTVNNHNVNIKLSILIVVANIRSYVDNKDLTLQVKQIKNHPFSQQWFSNSLCSTVRIRDLDKLNLAILVWILGLSQVLLLPGYPSFLKKYYLLQKWLENNHLFLFILNI